MEQTTATSIRLRSISVAELVASGKDLFRLHQQESEPQPRTIDPPIASYEYLEHAGNLIAFGAFDHDTLVGYVTMIVTPHLHYGIRVANHDLLFVHPDYRSRGVGLLIMRLAEEKARQMNAAEITWRCKPNSSLHDVLEARRTYQLEELLYRRTL